MITIPGSMRRSRLGPFGLNAIRMAVLLAVTAAGRADDLTLDLAVELSAQQDHPGAAVEFRRLALQTNEASARAAYFWSAGWEYAQAQDASRAESMLDRAEEADPNASRAANLLRGELALQDRRPAEAAFFYESVLTSAEDEALRGLAARRLAAARLREGRAAEARTALQGAPGDQTAGLQAIREFEEGRDKHPRVGGWLGVVPGLGYAYAGEYANAARSIILNGLFLWGMSNTAEDHDWGAFAVITFFEFTWYSGSIYGGIDASHRYNRARLQRAADRISGGVSFAPDYDQLPVLHLRVRF
jgi:tetratricopeptide (TPR) repeat protein